MSRRFSLFNIVFTCLAALLVSFVILPIASTLLAATPRQFWQTLSDPEVLGSTGLTFGAAGIASVLGLLTGVPLAYLLARRDFHGKRLVEALINLPVILPHTAAGVALLMVFGRRGLLGEPLARLGMTFTDNLGGIVVAMTFVSLPFLVNMGRESFRLVDEELEKVAMIDGASQWQAFWLVTLPLAWRGVLGGAVMMWARGISEFGAVVILAYHPKIMPVLIYERFEGFGLEAALPAAALLILAVLVVFALLRMALLPKTEKM